MNPGGLIFIATLLCFLRYIYNNFGFKEEKQQTPPKKPKTVKPLYINGQLKTATEQPQQQPSRDDWKTPERQVVENDYTFYNTRYHTLKTMLQTATATEIKLQKHLDDIYNLNQYGAVVADKVVKRFENELYTAQQKRLRIENQMHTARRGRDKALREMVK